MDRKSVMDVLYLDFDGVLHPDAVFRYRNPPAIRLQAPGHELFESAPLLDQLLAPYPDIHIVLSTSWVRELGFDDAREALSPALQARVVGATFHKRHHDYDTFSRLPRYVQIADDVQRRRPTRWLAIDDDLEGWPEHALARIVPMPPVLGLSSPDAALELERRLAKVFGCADKFLIHPDLARNAKVEWPDADLDQ
jgi:HAD domain in Swiss Army Knife RNA repair proteins